MAYEPNFTPVVLPADLQGQVNGKLGPCSLRAVYWPGVGHLSLHHRAADAFEAFAFKVWVETGVSLSSTGCYRSYEAQESAFRTRMTTDPTLARTPHITRTWNGVTWYLKPGYAPVATPGTSNHGWGIATDLAIFKSGKILGIEADAKVWETVKQYAWIYGLSWEGAKPGTPGWEPWHLRYVNGDAVPTAVQDFKNFVAANS